MQTPMRPAAEVAECSPSFRNVPWPVRPSPGINYNFVTYMYLAGSLLAILFFALEKHILAPLLLGNKPDDESHSLGTTEATNVGGEEGESTESWKEFAKGTSNGFCFVCTISFSLFGAHHLS